MINEKVLMCKPINLKIIKPINEIEKKYYKRNINTNLLLKQHQTLLNEIEKVAEVVLLTPKKNLPEQVFVRDAVYYLGDKAFSAKMASSIRRDEPKEIKKVVNINSQTFGVIEGGDVINKNDLVFIGYGQRTQLETIKKIQKNFNVIEVKLKKHILHLDCVLGFVKNYAVIYKKGIDKKTYKFLKERFKIIKINKREYKNFNTNFIIIKDTLFVANCSKRLLKIFKKIVKKVINVDLSEFFKFGGSVRCITQKI